jgi:hypothetical protein
MGHIHHTMACYGKRRQYVCDRHHKFADFQRNCYEEWGQALVTASCGLAAALLSGAPRRYKTLPAAARWNKYSTSHKSRMRLWS